MKSIISLLSRKGVSLYAETIDIQQFERALRELIGNGADVIMEDIYVRFRNQCGVNIEFESNLSAAEKIQKILELETH